MIIAAGERSTDAQYVDAMCKTLGVLSTNGMEFLLFVCGPVAGKMLFTLFFLGPLDTLLESLVKNTATDSRAT